MWDYVEAMKQVCINQTRPSGRNCLLTDRLGFRRCFKASHQYLNVRAPSEIPRPTEATLFCRFWIYILDLIPFFKISYIF